MLLISSFIYLFNNLLDILAKLKVKINNKINDNLNTLSYLDIEQCFKVVCNINYYRCSPTKYFAQPHRYPSSKDFDIRKFKLFLKGISAVKKNTTGLVNKPVMKFDNALDNFCIGMIIAFNWHYLLL